MIRLMLLCLLLFPTLAVAEDAAKPAPPPPTSWAGRYRLIVTEDKAWHQNALVITEFGSEEIAGTLEIDLGIGPDAREPTVDEKVHKPTVRGKRESANTGYVIETPIGSVQPILYRMELWPLETDKSLCGTLSIGNRKCGVWLSREGDR